MYKRQGITSLGYQVVWATLAGRADLDVRRLFADQGDPAHRDPELFGDKALRTPAGW